MLDAIGTMDAPSLPPLSLDVLKEVEEIERYAKDRISQAVTGVLNLPKVVRIANACVVTVFNMQAEYYLSLDGCSLAWLDDVEFRTRQIIVGLCFSAGIAQSEISLVEQHLREVLAPRLSHWKSQIGKNSPMLKESELAPNTPRKTKRQIREPNPELLKDAETVNRKQAAIALGVTERTLDRLVADRTLHPVGPFRSKRYKTKELLRLLNQKK